VALLGSLHKGTIQFASDQSIELLSEGLCVQRASASAFGPARQKLNPLALMSLSEHLVGTIRAHFALRRWHGRRPLAVDGSTVRLPATPDVIAAFGLPPEGARIPLARTSVLDAVLNTVVVEADLVPITVSERVLAGEHLAATRTDDLVRYDRGYPALLAVRAGCARAARSLPACAARILPGGDRGRGLGCAERHGDLHARYGSATACPAPR